MDICSAKTVAAPLALSTTSYGITVSVPIGSMAPVITSMQLCASLRCFWLIPAACTPSMVNFRPPAFQASNDIAIPSIDTRSKGGKSRSAKISSAKTQPTASEMTTVWGFGLNRFEKTIADASSTLTIFIILTLPNPKIHE